MVEPPAPGIFSVWPTRIRPSERPFASLMAVTPTPVFLAMRDKRVAFLHLVGAGGARWLGIAVVGGRRGRRGGLFLALRRLRQHREVLLRNPALVARLMLAARGFRLRRLRIVVGGRDACLVRIDVGRDDDLRAGLEAVGFAKPVRLHDDVGGHAEAARQIVDGLAFLDGDAGAAGARPALDVALFRHSRLRLDRAGRGVVDRLHGRSRSGLDRLGGGSCSPPERSKPAPARCGSPSRCRRRWSGRPRPAACRRDRSGRRRSAARADDLALIGGRRGHEVVDAAETRDLGTAPGGHSRQEKDGCPLMRASVHYASKH